MSSTATARLERLYREHHAPALRVLRHQVGDHAEDSLQTAWTILARILKNDPDYLNPTTARNWLVIVARRAAWRDQPAAPVSLDEPLGAGDRPSHTFTLSDTLAGRDELTARIELHELLDAIDTLSPGDRRSQLAALLGLTYDQEIDATGATYTNVNRHRTEGRAKLRARLGA